MKRLFKRQTHTRDLHFYSVELELHLRELGLSPFVPAEVQQREAR